MSTIQIQKQTIESRSDGLRLGMLLSEADAPKGVVQLCHGMSEHKERYVPFMEFLSENGYHCLIHDHRGHGESVLSPDDYGYFYDNGADAVIDDIYTINKYLHNQYMGLPLYLFGHSMGSLAVRAYCKKYDSTISGLIVCGSPSYNRAVSLGKFFADFLAKIRGDKFKSKMIHKMALGNYNKKFESEGSPHGWLSSDPAVVKAFDESPLCGFPFTVNGYSSLFTLMIEVYSKTGWKIGHQDLPILFISGEEDPCAVSRGDFLKAVGVMRKIGYTNVTYRLYENMRHEILNESGKKQVMEDVLAFLDKAEESIFPIK